jgi:hypothetical protein
LKPGTIDAVFDGLAPLRWCLFAEPLHAYRGQSIRLEAVLANEDVLAPGDYPVRLDVLDWNSSRVWSRQITLTIPPAPPNSVPPLAMPVFDQEVLADWPTGTYRFVATFERGAAAAGGLVEFYVTDAAEMPAIKRKVVLWGDDSGLAQWLTMHGVGVEALEADQAARRQLILASGKCSAPDKKAAYRDLLVRLARGSSVVFVTPRQLTDDSLPLPCGGRLVGLPSGVYHKDEWNRRHPVFAGLPTGGLMDYTFYRDIIPAIGWQGDTTPGELMAGAIHAAPGTGYASGLLLFGDRFEAGHDVVNILRIRDNLGKDPAAERLLRNLIEFVAHQLDDPTVPPPADLDRRLDELGL